jgi:hypothetical protein
MSVIIKGKNPRKPHTVRYWVDGRQRERSFATAREAQDFKIKTDHDTRAQIFVDDKLGREEVLTGCASSGVSARLAEAVSPGSGTDRPTSAGLCPIASR